MCEKREVVLTCPLSREQKALYATVQASFQPVVGTRLDGTPSDNGAGRLKLRTLNNVLMQLRQVCNHPYLLRRDDDSYDIDDNIVRSSGKMSVLHVLLQKLKKTQHKVLIFCQMTRMMDILSEYLDLVEYSYLRLDGSTKSQDRKERIQLFNSPRDSTFIFLLSTRAGGVGINLQAADTVILFDSDFNPQADLQAMSRSHRIGQVRLLCLLP
jgi:ATP-dependent helicase STH1/SNF2